MKTPHLLLDGKPVESYTEIELPAQYPDDALERVRLEASTTNVLVHTLGWANVIRRRGSAVALLLSAVARTASFEAFDRLAVAPVPGIVDSPRWKLTLFHSGNRFPDNSQQITVTPVLPELDRLMTRIDPFARLRFSLVGCETAKAFAELPPAVVDGLSAIDEPPTREELRDLHIAPPHKPDVWGACSTGASSVGDVGWLYDTLAAMCSAAGVTCSEEIARQWMTGWADLAASGGERPDLPELAFEVASRRCA